MNTNTPDGIGGDDLSMDEAVKAYAKGEPEAVSDDHADDDLETDVESAEHSDDEVDGEDQNEDDAENADEDEPEDSELITDDKRKVKLDDGTVITVGELKRGNLREDNYTRKTQAVAAVEAEVNTYRATLSQYEQQLAAARDLNIRILEQRMPQRPSADMLATDPLGYIQAERQYNDMVAEYQQLQAQGHQEREYQAYLANIENQKTLARETEALISKAPEFADASKKDALAREMLPIAAAYGFSPEEFGNIRDHRLVLALRDLSRLKKLSGATQKVAAKVQDRPPVQTGAKRLGPGQQQTRASDAAMNRLKQTGSLQDGVKAYLATQKR